LIEQVGLVVGIGEQVHTVSGWIHAIPEAFVRTRPTLCIYHAVALMFTNQLEAAEARLQDAERCLEADKPSDRNRVMVGQIATVRANLAAFAGDLTRCIELSYRGLELLPETEKIFLASARVNTGNISATLRAITLLARVHILQGRLHQAAATSSTRERLCGTCSQSCSPFSKPKVPHSISSLPSLDPLSEREREVLHLIAKGDSNCEIAEQLVVAVSTVKRHVSNIFSKLGVTNRTQAVARAREFGML
jgi:ATP/maltotriose-dependent transcriptional regulator MalT